jgi:N-acyl homoserine lactone hydrolase
MNVDVDVLIEGSGFPHLRGTVVLVQARSHRWLVDCGASMDREALIGALLARGLRPEDVDGVLLTHVHSDHCDNVDLFPAATVYVHRREMESLLDVAGLSTEEEITRRLRAQHERIHPIYQRFSVRWILSGGYRAILQARDVQILEGTTDIAEGVTMVDSPGHSPGHMSVRVRTHLETWVVGDLVSSEEDFRAGAKARPAICWSLDARAKSLTALAQRGGMIIPGHGTPFVLVRSEITANRGEQPHPVPFGAL